jgi:hypothetical protein
MDNQTTRTFTCTFTGADDKTDIIRLQELSDDFPFIEWGILFSFDRSGTPKYPSDEWISKFLDYKHVFRLNASLHLCGSAARGLLFTPISDRTIALFQQFDRIQVNINIKDKRWFSDHLLDSYATRLLERSRDINRPIIIQYNDDNAGLVEKLQPNVNKNIHVLKDFSGGNGIFNADYSIPSFCQASTFGSAGGISPYNVMDVLPEVHKNVMTTNIEHFWIDMEGKIRDTNNEFDLDYGIPTVAGYARNYMKLS